MTATIQTSFREKDDNKIGWKMLEFQSKKFGILEIASDVG